MCVCIIKCSWEKINRVNNLVQCVMCDVNFSKQLELYRGILLCI